jgi:allantoate deiminase
MCRCCVRRGLTARIVEAEAVIMERLEALGGISEEPDRLTRPFASPAMGRANDLVQSWMRQAGLNARTDALGNLIGHFPGPRPDSKILLLGSHLDTVRDAGKYDGPLGVVLAIACVEWIRQMKQALPFAIEVVAFADEEGARFQSAYLGSRALTGQLDEKDLALTDANGVTMAEAIRQFGGDATRLHSCRMTGKDLLGYVEVHIEQGPVLEEKNQAVGVVTAIAGQTRAVITLEGRAGHAGTTPMELRRDALCGAAEFILEAEKYARQHPGLVATVGQISTDPNASNVIPGTCRLTVDLRHQEDAVRANFLNDLTRFFAQLEKRRGLKATWQTVQETASVPCSAALSALLREAARKHQPWVIDLPSGAGHDAAILAKITPVAMLFVRCAGGVSHHPDEAVRPDDIRIALDVLTDFVLSLASRP